MSSRRRRTGVLGGATMAAAIGVMNLTTYGLTLACARLLGPDEFGQFSSVLGALIVLNVVSLALQATGARRVSTSTGDPSRIAHDVLTATLRAAAGVTLVGVLAVPLVVGGLRLDSVVGAVCLAVAAGLLTVMGGQAGILQGEQRWGALALLYVVMGTARLVAGGLALLVERSAAAALVGVAVAALAPVVVGAVALRRSGRWRTAVPVGAVPEAVRRTWEREGVAREVVHSAYALLAFFAVSNVDVLLARVVLPGDEAGHYAAGLVLTKAMLFLPQFVVVVLFPRMARGHDLRRTHAWGLGAILGLGLVAVAGVLLLRGLALAFVGGSAYAPVAPDLWLFASLGTVLAMVQLLVYGALARRHPRAVLLLWAALAATAALSLTVATAHELLLVKLALDALLLVVLGGYLLARTGPGEDPAVVAVDPPLAEDASSPEQPAVR
ncbi:oligosaccharide flippase family protein [Arthrobacter sp. NEB 688]|uniref:lipopolysaccharide biosynthesis protein n=1 Tax=Arthrobacter sp. NEB 688 TaxID=904039 RepID=UPI0015637DB4|nr:oligosaccharide flippase family protein [Arthrobacter sp. NEB 688]QKE84897.1 oligosaccharide flippase family protein [Arthrobacter sp. NEB 688]